MLASAGQPSLHGYDACMVYWTKGALRRNAGVEVLYMLVVGSLMVILHLGPGLIFLLLLSMRLIPARGKEVSRPGLRGKGMASIWANTSQDSSHVGNAGVGCFQYEGAPVALPTFATAQFKRFFDCGRAVRRLLPLGAGRFMHLVVL